LPLRNAQLLVLYLCTLLPACGETLGDVLQAHSAPIAAFTRSELEARITSWAASGTDDPFLLAYYEDDGSGFLNPPLRVIRYDHSGQVLRASLVEANAEFEAGVPMNCLGSVNSVSELPGAILLETHKNPSAGCVLVLSPQLALKASLSGRVLAVMRSECVIVQKSEVHFAPVHPMRIEVYDLRRSSLTSVYPPPKDEQRVAYSRALAATMDQAWCAANNASCDAREFENGLKGALHLNDLAMVFGFVAEFSPRSFGEKAAEGVGARDVAYVFRRRGEHWEHRAFPADDVGRLFGVTNLETLVRDKPEAAWQRPSR